jgi:hypothetical protein
VRAMSEAGDRISKLLDEATEHQKALNERASIAVGTFAEISKVRAALTVSDYESIDLAVKEKKVKRK